MWELLPKLYLPHGQRTPHIDPAPWATQTPHFSCPKVHTDPTLTCPMATMMRSAWPQNATHIRLKTVVITSALCRQGRIGSQGLQVRVCWPGFGGQGFAGQGLQVRARRSGFAGQDLQIYAGTTHLLHFSLHSQAVQHRLWVNAAPTRQPPLLRHLGHRLAQTFAANHTLCSLHSPAAQHRPWGSASPRTLDGKDPASQRL